jgi:hypothetical protein
MVFKATPPLFIIFFYVHIGGRHIHELKPLDVSLMNYSNAAPGSNHEIEGEIRFAPLPLLRYILLAVSRYFFELAGTAFSRHSRSFTFHSTEALEREEKETACLRCD